MSGLGESEEEEKTQQNNQTGKKKNAGWEGSRIPTDRDGNFAFPFEICRLDLEYKLCLLPYYPR